MYPTAIGGQPITGDPAKQKKPGEMQQPAGGGGNDDAQITPQSFGVPGAQAPSAGSTAPQTFAQMQAAGVARPAPMSMVFPPQPQPTPLPYPGEVAGPYPGNAGDGTGGPFIPEGGAAGPGGYVSRSNPPLSGLMAPTSPTTMPTPMPPTPQTNATPLPKNLAPAPTPAAPAPAPIRSSAGAASSGLGSQITQMLQQWLGDPSMYGNEDFQNLVSSGARQIDDQYALDSRAIDEEMARRGIFDSTIAGGKLHDLNIGKRSAGVELQDRANQFLAQKRSDDLARALGSAMGFYGDEQNRALQADIASGNRADRAAELALQRELGLKGLEGDAEDRTIRRDEIAKQFGLDSRRLDLSERESDRNYGLDTRAQDYREKEGDRRFDLDESMSIMDLLRLMAGQQFLS